MNYYITTLILICLLILLYLKKYCKTKNIKLTKNPTPDRIYTCLSYVSLLLKSYNIKHWICHGTLLGAIRSNDIIPHDYDFDIGAKLSDIDKIKGLNKIIKKDGYEFKKPSDNYGYKWDGTRKKIWRISLKIIFKNEIVGDIYLFQEFKDGITRRYDIKSETYFWPKMSFPTWFIRELDSVRIRNKYFPCPRNSKKLVEFWYGPNWQIPYKAPAQGGKSQKEYDYYGGYI